MWNFRTASLKMWLTIGLTFCLGLGIICIPSISSRGRGWDNYTILLVASSHALEDIHNRLAEEVDGEILSALTTQVSLNSYAGIEYLSLAKLSDSLDREDRRYDAYLKKLPEYFNTEIEGTSYHVLYLPRERNVLPLWWQLRSVLSGMRWQILEAAPMFSILSLVCLIGIVVWMVCAMGKKHRYLLMIAFLPFFRHLLGGEVLWGFIGLTVIIPWSFYLTQASSKVKGLRIDIAGKAWHVGWNVYLAGSWIAVLLFAVILGQYIVLTLGLQFFLGSLLLARHELTTFRREQSDHGVFRPVRIIAHIPGNRTLFFMQTLIVAIVVLLWGTISSLASSRAEVPVPFSSSSSSLSVLWEERAQHELPSIAEYLAHEAFQESFLFGGIYALPPEGESVYITRFRRKGNMIEKYREVLWTHDAEWFSSKLQITSRPSIETLLLDQGVMQVAKASMMPSALRPAHVAYLVLIIFFVGMLPLGIALYGRYSAVSLPLFYRMLKGSL